MKLVILLCLLQAALIVGNHNQLPKNKKIRVGRFPYIVSLRLHHVHICAATVISPTYLLTAASCFLYYVPQSYSVQYGNISKDRTNVLDVIRVVKHESFNATTHYNDIAVLEVNDGIPTSIRPAHLPTDANDERHIDLWFAMLVGWGDTKPDFNQIAKHHQWVGVVFETHNITRCNSDFRSKFNEEIQICGGRTGMVGPCYGKTMFTADRMKCLARLSSP